MQYSFVADDEVGEIAEFVTTSEGVSHSEIDYVPLQEAGVSAQRLAMSRLLKEYVDGSMSVAFSDGTKKWTGEKMFHLTRLLEWNDGDPDVVVDALRVGRLRCRLSARMGIGKSSRLPSYIAKALNYRVLHVARDADALQQISVHIQKVGIGKYSRRWKGSQCASVSCMTYSDFNGIMVTGQRNYLFQCFDVIIFDEGFLPEEPVFVAKRNFAVYAPASTNLLVCSATIRVDRVSGDGGAEALGQVKHVSRPFSVREALDSGKLYSEYLVDRSIVIAPDNQTVYEIVEGYESVGVDVKFLDDASEYESLAEVFSWLEGDSTTPRVAVLHVRYCIAYNFPLNYAVVFPYETVQEYTDTKVISKLVPLTEAMVSQGLSRVGRGIVKGSSGIVMSPERVEVGELKECDKMRAFVKLCAASIRPLRNEFWEKPYLLFPEGLSANLAQNILRLCLPVEIAVRYLARDGKYARRFCAALNSFAQPDHYLVPSDYEDPVGYEGWQCEPLLYMPEGADITVRVPLLATGELQVVMHVISEMADGKIVIPRWRPSRGFAMNDGYDSEEERVTPRYGPVVTKLRRVEGPRVEVEVEDTVPQVPWAYRQLEGFDQPRRVGGYIDSDRCKEAMLELERNLRDYHVPVPTVGGVYETEGGSHAALIPEGMGNVESPGGSVVCSLPVSICEKVNCGKRLSADDYVKLVVAARGVINKFVTSKLFDGYSSPWDSVLGSLLDPVVVDEVMKRGLATDTYNIVDSLRGRFSVELKSVLANSYIFKRTYLKIFYSTPSLDKVMRAIRKGKFDDIAQTTAFIERVKKLKELMDTVLLEAERRSIFLPTHITNAQRALPLRGDDVLGYVGTSVHEMPRSWRKQIEGKSEVIPSWERVGKDVGF